MTGYEFHPEAHVDLAEIWELIRADNLDAADRAIGEFCPPFARWFHFPVKATDAPTSPRVHCASFGYANT